MSTPNEVVITRRIGNTTYKVRVAILEDGMETMEEKILRMIQNEAGKTESDCGIMEPPQVGRPA